jgi:methyl-accepting chemotaxis protein
MLQWVKRRISLKIAIALFIVLSLIMSVATWILVKSRSDALRQQMNVKARTMAVLGAETMELVLNQAVLGGTFKLEEIFDTDYQPITYGPLAGGPVPKYHTIYDKFLDARIRKIQDDMVAQDSSVVFAVLVDRNGYLPTHNTKFSQPLTGNPEKDRVNNRTKQIFNDKVGLAAARYDGSDGGQVLRQEYRSATGKEVWDVAAPVFVQGRHWGAFRIGFSVAQVEAAVGHLRNSLILYMLAVQVISFLTIYLILAYFIRPLNRLTFAADRIAEGHLDQRVEIDSEDEIGKLGKAFNRMTQVIFKDLEGEIEKSNRLVSSVKETIQQLSTSANEITAISTQQSTGATQQASAVQEATTTSEEIAVTAKQVAEIALQVEGRAEQASQASNGGMQTVADAVEGMGQLQTKVRSIAEAMLELGENSQKIGGIVDIIDEISDQTNLLALNAAIEAAGAGEAGKRFSIVASEVKRLAGRTVDATGQIKGLIEQIQKATNSTIMLTEEGSKGVETASSLVGRVSEALGNILTLVQETTGAAREIKLSTQQQTTASEQMAETIIEIRDVATQVAAGSEETAQAIAELTRLAEELRDFLETGLQEKGKSKAVAGAQMLENILNEALKAGQLSEEDLFDVNYVPIPGTEPQKYRTRYDAYLDETITPLLDSFLKDNQVVFAVLADRNGYVPTHNSKFSRPLTGDREVDRKWNRGKRMFNDQVGLKAARNEEGVLVQVYERDTGEKMWDISAPVLLRGKHWGAFRLGYCM